MTPFGRASLRKSLADVTRRKGRTLLMVLGIFIGVFGLTGINVTQDTILDAYAYTLGLHTVQPDILLRVDSFDSALLPALRAVANVKTLRYQENFLTQWHIAAAPGHVAMAIDSFDNLQQAPFQLTSGRYPGAGEIVLEYGDTGIQPAGIGAIVTVDSPHGPVNLRVVGLARRPGENPASSGLAIGFMSQVSLEQLAGGADPQALQHVIQVYVTNGSQVHTSASALQHLLQAQHVSVLSVNYAHSPDPAVLAAIDGAFTMLRILAILALVLSGLLILNMVTALIAEQTAIIGTMKALGGGRGTILRGYLVSVGIYGLLGTVFAVPLGCAAGYALATALAPQIPLDVGPFAIAPWIVPLGLAVGLGVPILAALVPLLNGTRISIRDALAAYGVSASSAGWTAHLPGMTRVPQTVWLGLRGLFRKRWRASLTLVTLIVAGASFLVVQTTASSINSTIAASHNLFDYDVSLFLRSPQAYDQVLTTLSAVPNIGRIEPYASTNTSTQWGTVGVEGYAPDTQMYHYQLTGGRWLRSGDTNVVLLSDDVAAKTGLHVGDTLFVNNMALTIVGTVHQHIDTLGWIGAVVTTVDTANLLAGLPASLRLAVQARDRSPAAINTLTDALDTLLSSSSPDLTKSGLDTGAQVETRQSYTARRQQNWYVLYYLLYGVAMVVGVAGALGLANALAASVLERRREIGMLRAMGASGRRVAQVFWVEALALGAVSWCCGVALGLPLAYAFLRELSRLVLPMDFYVDPLAFAVMLAAIIAIASLASLVPAWRASHVRIASILRYE